MTPIDLPYLWCRIVRKANGKVYRHWNYRRNGLVLPITAADGARLSPDDGSAFVDRWRAIHSTFETEHPESVRGSMADLIATFKAAPEYRQLAATTRRSSPCRPSTQ